MSDIAMVNGNALVIVVANIGLISREIPRPTSICIPISVQNEDRDHQKHGERPMTTINANT